LKYLGEDPDIRVIAVHMEGVHQGKEFLELAERIVREKPVIIHKTGSSEQGAPGPPSLTAAAWRAITKFAGRP